MGIEPTFSAWEADVLPLNYTRVCRDSRVSAAIPEEGRYDGFIRAGRFTGAAFRRREALGYDAATLAKKAVHACPPAQDSAESVDENASFVIQLGRYLKVVL